MSKLKKEKKVRIKAWAVVGVNLPLIAHKSYNEGGMEFCIYRAKYSAEDNCTQQAKQSVVPVTITYSLPITKSKNVIK